MQIRYTELQQRDLETIGKYIPKILVSNILKNPELQWTTTNGLPHLPYVHLNIGDPELVEDFPTLFGPNGDFLFVIFTKNNEKYRLNQEFGVGGVFCYEEFIGDALDEELLRELKEEDDFIGVGKVMDISRVLMRSLTGGEDYSETNEIETITKWVTYRPYPHLVHRFLHTKEREIYTGSEINLEEEVEFLEQSTLDRNIKIFYETLQKIKEGTL